MQRLAVALMASWSWWAGCVGMAQEGAHGDGDDETTSRPVEGPALNIEVFADRSQVKNVTAICFDDRGRLYVAESDRWRNGVEDNRHHLYWVMDDLASKTVADRAAMIAKWLPQKFAEDYFTRETDRVVGLVDTDGDGKADERTVFAENFDEPVDGPAIGLLWGEEKLYLTCIPHVWALEDLDDDGRADTRTSILEGFGPRFSLSGHDLHGLVWGPDGRLYFSVGDRGYHLELPDDRVLADPGAGAVFRCRPDGSEVEVFHFGLRNPQELAFNEFGDLFTVDNNSDQGDEARVCYLMEGGDAGWHMGHQALTTFSDQVEDGHLEQVPHWLSEGLWKKRFEDQPEWIVPPIDHLTDGPSGLVFNSGTSLSDRYRNHFLVCDYKGSPRECFLYSFRVRPEGAAYVMEDAHVFHQGITAADVTIGYDGKIYLGDFGGGWERPDRGNIFALFDMAHIGNPVVEETRSLFANGFSDLPEARLGRLLGHPDWRVRLRSQFALVAKGEPGRETLKAAVSDPASERYARFHGLWGLGQMEGTGEFLAEYLDDPDEEIRAQVARLLGELPYEPAADALVERLEDSSARVRAFAAISLGKLAHADALPSLLAMIVENDNRDVFLRHAGVMALVGAGRSAYLAGLREHPSPSVRLAAVLALRKLRDPEIAVYLRDPDPQIVDEAIRAINDLPIEEAVPKLANFSRRFMTRDFTQALPDEPIFRRLINANFRLADPPSAQRLMFFGVNRALPADYRLLSLKALSLWPKPPPIDPTTGTYRPLERRHPGDAVLHLQEELVDLLNGATESDLIEAGIRVADAFAIPVKPRLLHQWLVSPQLSFSCRSAVLDKIMADPPLFFVRTLDSLLRDPDPHMRVAAVKATIRLDEAASRRMAYLLLREGQSVVEKRGAYEILARSEDEACADLLIAELRKLAAGAIEPELRLDVYEAGLARQEPVVAQTVASLSEKVGAKGIFGYTLAGGDPKRGEAVFANQGTCLKCHEVETPGGDAGPSLRGVASRLSPEQLLASITDPNADIVEGYGMTNITLKDGRSITGAPLDEDEQTVLIKGVYAAPERVLKSEIESQTPPVSAMPPLGLVLPKRDIRDLMAYLLTLR